MTGAWGRADKGTLIERIRISFSSSRNKNLWDCNLQQNYGATGYFYPFVTR